MCSNFRLTDAAIRIGFAVWQNQDHVDPRYHVTACAFSGKRKISVPGLYERITEKQREREGERQAGRQTDKQRERERGGASADVILVFHTTEIADYETHKECITGLEAERYCLQQSLCDLAHTKKGGYTPPLSSVVHTDYTSAIPAFIVNNTLLLGAVKSCGAVKSRRHVILTMK